MPQSKIPMTEKKQKTSLITGVNGFVGRYLYGSLARNGHRVAGIDIQDRTLLPELSYYKADINDFEMISDIITRIMPDEIFHLAAVSSPAFFGKVPYPSFQINLMGAISIFESVKKINNNAVILCVGSSKEYLPVHIEGGITESGKIDPSGYYGASKQAVEIIGNYYVKHHDLDIRFTRSFNHTGPGQTDMFVCSDWARQAALIKKGKASPNISVGNIDEAIDFSDVRDVVEAYRLIVENGRKGEVYNVCSGKAVNLAYIIDYLKRKCDIEITIQKTPVKFSGKSDTANLIGNNSKIRTETGWKPEITIEKTLDDLYSWWLDNIK
jgi:GDP-4-dehydro-6-deoxy-D-mannose reductase